MNVLDSHIHIGNSIVRQQDLIEKMNNCRINGGILISISPKCFDKNKITTLSNKQRIENVLQWSKTDKKRILSILLYRSIRAECNRAGRHGCGNGSVGIQNNIPILLSL